MGVAANSVKLVNGILQVVQAGDQTYESITLLDQKIKRLSESLAEIRILVDHRGVGNVNIGARKAALSVARHTRFDKMAFFGTSPYMTGLINLLARSTGKQHKLHFATTKQEALAWLEQK